MVEYNALMLVTGPVILAGIVFMWDIARKAEKLRLGTRRISTLILIGGILTAAGFLLGPHREHYLTEAVLVMLGPTLIAYGLSESGMVQPKLEMLVQAAVMLVSIGMSTTKTHDVMLIFSSLSVLIMMDAVAFYRHTPRPQRNIARISAWLFVLFTVLNKKTHGSSVALGFYVVSILLWLGTLISLEFYLRNHAGNNEVSGH